MNEMMMKKENIAMEMEVEVEEKAKIINESSIALDV